MITKATSIPFEFYSNPPIKIVTVAGVEIIPPPSNNNQ